MADTIRYRDMLGQMESSKCEFSLKWVSLDLARRTGGEIKAKEGLVLKRNKVSKRVPKTAGNRQKPKPYFRLYSPSLKRYWTVYKRLIISFNGLNVIY